jgi:hypothetical protein
VAALQNSNTQSKSNRLNHGQHLLALHRSKLFFVAVALAESKATSALAVEAQFFMKF